jgi:hypothetical protein
LGLRAYGALIEALRRDENFPMNDIATLTFRAQVLTNDGIPLMEMKRLCASRFLLELIELQLPGEDALKAAARIYQQEAEVLHCAAETMPLSYDPVPERLKLADRKFREELAKYAQQARKLEEQAVEHLEQALIELETGRTEIQ